MEAAARDSGVAKRRRAQHTRQTARRVRWLLELQQADTSHHASSAKGLGTGAAWAPMPENKEVLPLVTSLVEKVQTLED